MTYLKRDWPWIVALFVSAAWGLAVTAASFFWYFETALTPNITLTDAGQPVVGPQFAYTSLGPAIVFALLGGAVGSAVAIGIYFLSGRRVRPTLFAVAAGPVLAFLLYCAATLYDGFFDASTGEDYLGLKPVVLLGHAIIILIPSLISAAAVVLMARSSRSAKRDDGLEAPPR